MHTTHTHTETHTNIHTYVHIHTCNETYVELSYTERCTAITLSLMYTKPCTLEEGNATMCRVRAKLHWCVVRLMECAWLRGHVCACNRVENSTVTGDSHSIQWVEKRFRVSIGEINYHLTYWRS